MPDLTDARLDALLRQTAQTLPSPRPGALRTQVLDVIVRQHDPAPPPSGIGLAGRRATAFAAAVVLAASLAVALAAPGARTAVGEFFGIVTGQRIEIVTPTATAPASATTGVAAPAPTRASPTFLLSEVARPVTLAQAEDMLSPLAVPSDAGEPEAIYALRWGDQPLVVITYPDFDLWQTRGGGYFGKQLPADVALEQLLVDGQPGWWIADTDHLTTFHDEEGREVMGSQRTVDRHALIWESDGAYYRIETELPLAEARAIAESLP